MTSPTFSSRLDERDDGDSIQKYLFEKTSQRTVPNVFVSEYTMLSFQSEANILNDYVFDLDRQHIGGQALFAANIVMCSRFWIRQ